MCLVAVAGLREVCVVAGGSRASGKGRHYKRQCEGGGWVGPWVETGAKHLTWNIEALTLKILKIWVGEIPPTIL